MWRKLAMLLLVPVAAMVTGAASAQASPETTPAAELCSPSAVFGSYALRACIEPVAGGVHGYAYISLEAGHSPCEVRLRYEWSDGTVSPLFVAPCPSGAVTHFKVSIAATACCGKIRTDASIRRTTDGNINPRAQSPWLTV
jgi:hypothetical protein